MLPDAVQRLVRHLARLPGVGERSATRLAFHLLGARPELAEELGRALLEVHAAVARCERCGHLTEEQPCGLCRRQGRDDGQLCVVEGSAELLAIERSGAFRGRYHVLGGLISPLNGVGPDRLRIEELLGRLRSEPVREIIFALPPSLEGDATALYLQQRLAPSGLTCSRLAQGLPLGSELQYADEGTLARALEHRRPLVG